VQPAWIERAGSHLLKRSYSEPHWQSRAGQVAAFETITLYGLTLFSRRRINYGPINPAEAREVFLRAALVEGDFETRAPFWRHNQALIEEVHQLEAKSRRRDILVDEEGIYAFYDERVPSGIYSKPQFERWLRKATRTTPKRLHMDLEQVMQHDARAITAEQYPNHLRIGATELPLEYHFEPGQEVDGVTLVLPQLLINQVSPERLQWLVPGLLTERITAMLRGLPKTLRRAFVPVPDTAARVAARLTPSDRPLVRAVAEELKALTGEQVPEDAWDDSALPPYLRMKVRLVDTEGRTLALDDDLLRLKRRQASGGLGGDLGERSEDRREDRCDGRASPGLGTTLWKHPIERDGLKRWDFGDLPEHLDLDRAGIRLRGWPALVDQGDAVAVRVLDSEQSATLAMRAGLRRLIMLTLGGDLRVLRRGLCETAGGLDRMRLLYAKAAQPPASARLASITPAAATSATAPAVSDQAAATKRTTNGPKRGKKKRKGGGKGSAGAASSAAGTALAGADLVDELLALILDLTFTEGQPPIRDQASFDQRLSANQPRLFSVAQEVCALATTILGTYQGARKRLDGITQVQWMPSVLDMRAHLDALVYRGFFVQVPFGHLQDYPRYLRALEQRAEKLPLAATRDRERMQALAPLVERWRERSSAAESAEREDERLEEIRWMLEELRVSLFAQQLGTAYPVSVKRIERRWQELGL
jgi:ATP-dependent helicase HrpA